MKKYEKPYLLVEEIEIEDVIASSSGGVNHGSETTSGDSGWIGGLPWNEKGGNE